MTIIHVEAASDIEEGDLIRICLKCQKAFKVFDSFIPGVVTKYSSGCPCCKKKEK